MFRDGSGLGMVTALIRFCLVRRGHPAAKSLASLARLSPTAAVRSLCLVLVLVVTGGQIGPARLGVPARPAAPWAQAPRGRPGGHLTTGHLLRPRDPIDV